MPQKLIDLTGKVFGRLTVLHLCEGRQIGKVNLWRCRCECGELRDVQGGALRGGYTKSCGCYRADRLVKHGHSQGPMSPTYTSWASMRTRCRNKGREMYKYYGGKGISVCERWNDFSAFLEDMGEKPIKGWHIDRIDPTKDYQPGNCEWVSPSENALRMNRRRREMM